MNLETAKSRAAALMPGLTEDLKHLVTFPSCAFPGFPPEPVHAMRKATVELFGRYGVEAQELDLGGGYPAIYADIPGPEGAPTVLLYAHYDVQPAPAEQGWETEPFTPTLIDGRLYGRGAADDKSGIVIHAGTLGVFEGELPVGVRLLIEGEEETASHLGPFVDANPDLFYADAYVIADTGNGAAGVPSVTTSLRGNVVVNVTVTSLHHAAHSGLFGGAAPDALLALIRLLSRLHTDDGTPAVEGLYRSDWSGVTLPVKDFVKASGMLEGTELIGQGSLESRLWSYPAISVIGIDAPSVKEASNVVLPTARAKITMRVPPGADSREQVLLLEDHLRRSAPWGVQVDLERVRVGQPYAARVDGPFVTSAMRALEEAFGRPAGTRGTGGSIGLVASLQAINPKAETVLWGAEDMAEANIHAGNESVDLAEIERMIVAQALTLEYLGRS